MTRHSMLPALPTKMRGRVKLGVGVIIPWARGSYKPSIGILSKGMPLEGDRGGEPLKCPLVGVVGSRDLLVAIVIMGLAAPWVRGGGHGEGSRRGRPWCLSRS